MGLVYRLLEECWGHREGWVFLPAKDNGKWLERGSYVWPRDGAVGMEVDPSIDNYFSPLVFSEPRRRKEYALPTHVLWADLDEADPEQCALRPSAAWKTTQGGFSAEDLYFATGLDFDTEAGMEVYSSMVAEGGTKPHWQALWFLKREDAAVKAGLISRKEIAVIDAQWGVNRDYIPADDAAQLSRRIAYAEGADKSGWDVTQVLRLPGTYNHKHTPPQRIELLWAERRYYTVAEVETAYPSVPEAPPSSGTLTPVEREEADKALGMLPMGLLMALERPAGGDRSLEIMKLAEGLTRFGVDAPVALALLERSPLVQSKYGGRRDMRARLLTALSDAFMVVHKEVQR